MVGFRAILTYSDDEQGLVPCAGYQSAQDDDISSIGAMNE